jgi:uncharacterized repeat protein (TIGR01451 family)
MMNRTLAAIALSLLCALTVAADTTLQASLQLADGAAPGDQLYVTPVLRNTGSEAASDVVFTVTLPPGSIFPDTSNGNGWTCTADRPTLTCHIPSIAPSEHSVLATFIAILGGDSVGETDVPLTVTAANAPRIEQVERFFVWRLFTVTNTNDSGPGSLRDALTRANQLCTAPAEQCKIEFEVAVPATFEPLTPLPPITACAMIWIDAAAMSPEGHSQYELSGAKVSSGSGLELRANCDDGARMLWLYGLTINRFPEDGLRIHPSGNDYSVRLGGLRVGTDPTGSHPRPNAWRGISITSPAAYVSLGGSHVSANGRSGVYVWDARGVEMTANSIIGNGASGVFLNRGTVSGYQNTIVQNAQWGVSVVPGAHMGLIQNNSIHSNGAPAIDWGLDGRTPQEPAGGAAAPVVQSATYNAAEGTTTIRGTIDVQIPQGVRYEVHIYSNASGRAEAERYEGRSEMYSIYVPAPGVYPWEVLIRSDLRGRTLTALTGVGVGDDFPVHTGSELSLPFAVE